MDDNFEDMNIDELDLDNFSGKVVEEAKTEKVSEPKITEECLSEGWETISVNVVNQENISVDTSTLPMATNKEGEKVFRFYWWDAFEEPFKQPGVVFLFGKGKISLKFIFLLNICLIKILFCFSLCGVSKSLRQLLRYSKRNPSKNFSSTKRKKIRFKSKHLNG